MAGVKEGIHNETELAQSGRSHLLCCEPSYENEAQLRKQRKMLSWTEKRTIKKYEVTVDIKIFKKYSTDFKLKTGICQDVSPLSYCLTSLILNTSYMKLSRFSSVE